MHVLMHVLLKNCGLDELCTKVYAVCLGCIYISTHPESGGRNNAFSKKDAFPLFRLLGKTDDDESSVFLRFFS